LRLRQLLRRLNRLVASLCRRQGLVRSIRLLLQLLLLPRPQQGQQPVAAVFNVAVQSLIAVLPVGREALAEAGSGRRVALQGSILQDAVRCTQRAVSLAAVRQEPVQALAHLVRASDSVQVVGPGDVRVVRVQEWAHQGLFHLQARHRVRSVRAVRRAVDGRPTRRVKKAR